MECARRRRRRHDARLELNSNTNAVKTGGRGGGRILTTAHRVETLARSARRRRRQPTPRASKKRVNSIILFVCEHRNQCATQHACMHAHALARRLHACFGPEGGELWLWLACCCCFCFTAHHSKWQACWHNDAPHDRRACLDAAGSKPPPPPQSGHHALSLSLSCPKIYGQLGFL